MVILLAETPMDRDIVDNLQRSRGPILAPFVTIQFNVDFFKEISLSFVSSTTECDPFDLSPLPYSIHLYEVNLL